MGQRYGEEFKREAVRFALTSGLPRKHLLTGLGMVFNLEQMDAAKSR